MTTVDRHARLWEAERPRLTGLAYRILGSWHDAEDVVATAWARLAGQGDLDRPEAWLTTVVTRLSIDASRRARSRRETYVGEWLPEPVATGLLPEDAAVAGSLLGLGMLRLMDRLDPVDRAISCCGRRSTCRTTRSASASTAHPPPADRWSGGPG